MPRENRKRGKKHKKVPDEPETYVATNEQAHVPKDQAEPSWIVSGPSSAEDINPEAPFGYVDTDVKAYFRTVDVQIRDWQESEVNDAESTDHDPNEGVPPRHNHTGIVLPQTEKRLFFVAALSEMAGKEKQLATDPDCSIILERMAYSMDDFVRRVFVDSLGGS